MIKGFIYIAINESMPGLLKVGRSSRVPEKRMEELSNTSVPTPFYFLYSVLVNDSEKTEKEIHAKLSEFRVDKNREFFEIAPKSAIEIIQKNVNILYEEYQENKNSDYGIFTEKSNEFEREKIIARDKILRQRIAEEKEAQIVKEAKLKSEVLERAAIEAEACVQSFNANRNRIERLIEIALNSFNEPSLMQRFDGVPWVGKPGAYSFGSAFMGKGITLAVYKDGNIEVNETENNILKQNAFAWTDPRTGFYLDLRKGKKVLVIGQYVKGVKCGYNLIIGKNQTQVCKYYNTTKEKFGYSYVKSGSSFYFYSKGRERVDRMIDTYLHERISVMDYASSLFHKI